MPAYTVDDMEREGSDGGFYIGNQVKPRDFSLDCYVEEITAEQREGLMQWLDRNTSGTLVFDHRPHVHYEVHPIKRIEITQYTHSIDGRKRYSGTFTIAFRAYDPFGKLFRNWFDNNATEMELIETGLISSLMMPPYPTPSTRDFLLYNCGFERAHTLIRLAGSAAMMVIENKTTGQKCVVKDLRAGDIPPGATLEISSETGQVWLNKGEERELAFYYHDLGYIMLAPCLPFARDIQISHTMNSKVITSNGGFLPHMAGQYVWLRTKWCKIQWVNDTTAYLDTEAAVTGVSVSPIVAMNEISVYGNGISLTRLDIDYEPRIR